MLECALSLDFSTVLHYNSQAACESVPIILSECNDQHSWVQLNIVAIIITLCDQANLNLHD